MKLNKNFIGINYFQTPAIQEKLIEILMDKKMLQPVLEIANWNEQDIITREKSLKDLHDNTNHKFYYITKKVQDHSELIKYEKINLGWFRKMKSQMSTYIINRHEFFRFKVVERKEIYVLHFYKDPQLSDEEFDFYRNMNVPYAEFNGYKFDTFKIYIDEEKYPDGFMPENELWNQNPINKQRFVKLLLFIELTEPTIEIVKDNQKIKLDDSWEKSMDGKVKNESGVNVILVNTMWNKVIINDSGFSVKGHIRIQPYGPGRTLYKPIWIDEFQKSGYIRGIEKLK